MRRYAVIGNPVRHSRSPWLHGVFARQTQRPIVYAALQPTAGSGGADSADDFAHCAADFFSAGGSGINITLPYKADALAFADHASAFARRVNAANVLKRDSAGKIHAYNTDGAGLLRHLQTLLGADANTTATHLLGGRTILLLGAGGAARAAAHAIADAKPAVLWIHNRTQARAEELAADCNNSTGGSVAQATAQPQTGADIIINATSAGHSGSAAQSQYPPTLFGGAALAYDLSYGEAAKPFTAAAAKGGAGEVADGTGMLAWQAALSFALWEGVLPSPTAAIKQLSRHSSG